MIICDLRHLPPKNPSPKLHVFISIIFCTGLAALQKYMSSIMNASKHQCAQQRIISFWVVGGALIIAASSLLFYRKYSRRRRQHLGDDLEADDLIFGHEDKEPDEELRRVFGEAAKVARSLGSGKLDQRDQLMLYGLYKQATEGDRKCDDDRGPPSKFNVVAHAKYNAWGKFKGLSTRFAMQKYCEVVYHFAHGGASAYNSNSGSNSDNDDIVYDDEDDDDDDDDVDSQDDGIDPGGMGHRPSTLSIGFIEGKSSQDEVMSTANALDVRLRNAAIANDVDALQWAIQGGCDIDAADDDGQTALHFAADRKSLDCLSKLIEAGANVNALDCDGFGVLQIALSSGLDIESIRLLLEAGANPDARDDDGESPRSWVAEEGSGDMIELFASYPARDG